MKERPIPFTDPMVRAILEGRKTMTRRVMKPQPEFFAHNGILASADADKIHCPYGQPGDRLWVKETFEENLEDNDKHILWETTAYKAGYQDSNGSWITGTPYIKWHSSRYMPRRLARIILEITDVRVERVQDISEEDAECEGAYFQEFGKLKYCPMSLVHPPTGWSPKPYFVARSYLYGFYELWDSINAKRGYGWDANPWVWVIEFKRIDNGAA